MKLEHQVCSLKLSKRLKELGVNQESYFYWYQYTDEQEVTAFVDTNLKYGIGIKASAFTVAELGQLTQNHSADNFQTYYNQDKMKYYIGAYDNHYGFYADTEADARAMLLCYLLENELIALAA